MPEIYIGLMSGTSLDGVDGVLVDFAADAKPLSVLAHVHRPFDATLRDALRALNATGADELHRAALAGTSLAHVYASAVKALLDESHRDASDVVAIGAHGQTVRHRPGAFDGVGYPLQLNNPSLLAELAGIDVVADLRSRDVAAAGQGAPLVPAFHRAVFGVPGQMLAVLNLGGIANLTATDPSASTIGFDCGPANALMDEWCERHRGEPFDAQGAWAASGTVLQPLLASMLADPYFALPPPKSTGRDRFHGPWLETLLQAHAGAASQRAEDVQATLAELTARSCADAVLRHAPQARELLVCGGGAFNIHLMGRLAALLPQFTVMNTGERGLPASQVEATAFAWLAREFTHRRPGNLPDVTGAKGLRVLGALWPK
ncbi:MAG: anhydro-N-acetylmuramic acid kinase [Rhizobacter sp.]|nr:anhydro-N-acetylmuramic acid kinase [Rhizobacter sp.]